jgi:hypothetical protein
MRYRKDNSFLIREHVKAAGIAIITAMLIILALLTVGRASEQPALTDPDIQKWYQQCSQNPGCRIISRNVKILNDSGWQSEPVLIMRTPAVIDFSIARFKSAKGTIYIVLLIPDQAVDASLIKLLGGK